MPRPRRTPASAAADATPLLKAAERLVSQIETLVDDIAGLRSENDSLRREVRDAVLLLERAASAAAGQGRRRGSVTTRETPRRRNGHKGAARGRATPAEVTPEVVRAVIAKLGPSTAAEIAKEISRAGAVVSGRAVRFIAERGGAIVEVGQDGQRRYRLDPDRLS